MKRILQFFAQAGNICLLVVGVFGTLQITLTTIWYGERLDVVLASYPFLAAAGWTNFRSLRPKRRVKKLTAWFYVLNICVYVAGLFVIRHMSYLQGNRIVILVLNIAVILLLMGPGLLTYAIKEREKPQIPKQPTDHES